MRRVRLTFGLLLLGFLSVLCVALSGCKKNALTYKNDGALPLARVCLFVELSKPFPDFNDVNQVEWSEPYGAPDVNVMTDEAGAHWKVCWDLTPEEYIQPGKKFKQTVKLPRGINIKKAETWDVIPSGGRGSSIQSPGIGLAWGKHPDDGLVLELVLGTEQLGSLIIEELRWTTTNEDLPFENLLPGDPLLESLSWENVTFDLPLALTSASVPSVFDLPDAMLIGKQLALVRVGAYSPFSGDRQEYVTANTISFVPTASEWGLVVMALLLLAAGTIVVCRNRRGSANHA